jgi:hypothetical protein
MHLQCTHLPYRTSVLLIAFTGFKLMSIFKIWDFSALSEFSPQEANQFVPHKTCNKLSNKTVVTFPHEIMFSVQKI